VEDKSILVGIQEGRGGTKCQKNIRGGGNFKLKKFQSLEEKMINLGLHMVSGCWEHKKGRAMPIDPYWGKE